jgi:hypothetical protein
MITDLARELNSESEEVYHYRYSICTLVSKPQEYIEMIESFKKAGFKDDFCEYLYINNSQGNKYEAFAGINKFLLEAKGKYIILCHQDILLNQDNLDILEQRINEINNIDSHWAIIGNAGAVSIKNIVYRITEPANGFQQRGQVPAKVQSVDENFILVKRSANLVLSKDLNGFHLYGTDLCIIADILGYTSYVVHFNLLHKSKGNANKEFYKIKKDLIRKYKRAFKGRYIQTCITNFYISDSKFKNFFYTSGFAMFWARQYFKIKTKMQGS